MVQESFEGLGSRSNPFREVSTSCVAYSVFREASLLEF